MQTMDAALAGLVKHGTVTQAVAYERCHDPEELARLISGSGTVSSNSSYDGGMVGAPMGGSLG